MKRMSLLSNEQRERCHTRDREVCLTKGGLRKKKPFSICKDSRKGIEPEPGPPSSNHETRKKTTAFRGEEWGEIGAFTSCEEKRKRGKLHFTVRGDRDQESSLSLHLRRREKRESCLSQRGERGRLVSRDFQTTCCLHSKK